MQIKYEYEIRTKDSNSYLERAFVRDDARTIKNQWKDAGFDVKIVQRKYVLTEQKEIR